MSKKYKLKVKLGRYEIPLLYENELQLLRPIEAFSELSPIHIHEKTKFNDIIEELLSEFEKKCTLKLDTKCKKHSQKNFIQIHVECAFCKYENSGGKMDEKTYKFFKIPYKQEPLFSFLNINGKLIKDNHNNHGIIGYYHGKNMIDPFDAFKSICTGEETTKKLKLEGIIEEEDYNELAKELFRVFKEDKKLLDKKYKMYKSGGFQMTYVGLLNEKIIFKIEEIGSLDEKELKITKIRYEKEMNITNKAAEIGLSGKIYYGEFFDMIEGKRYMNDMIHIILMERIIGLDFNGYFRDKNRTMKEIEILSRNTTSRVHELHSYGLVHGDMAGRNILLVHDDSSQEKELTPMFIDFTETNFFREIDNTSIIDLEKLIKNNEPLKAYKQFRKKIGLMEKEEFIENMQKLEEAREEYISKFRTTLKAHHDIHNIAGYAFHEEHVFRRSKKVHMKKEKETYILSKNAGYFYILYAINFLTLTEIFGIEPQEKGGDPFEKSFSIYDRSFMFKNALEKYVDMFVTLDTKYRSLMEKEIFPNSIVYHRKGKYIDNIIQYILYELVDEKTHKFIYEPFVFMIITMIFIVSKVKENTYDDTGAKIKKVHKIIPLMLTHKFLMD